MDIMFSKTRIRKRTFCAIFSTPFSPGVLSTSHSESFSSLTPLQPTRNNNRAHKSPRILDLVTSKPNLSVSGQQIHLRLVQEVLQSNSNQLGEKEQLGSDGTYSSSKECKISSQPGEKEQLGSDITYSCSKDDPILKLFWLQKEGLRADPSVLSQALSSCGCGRTVSIGIQVHCLAIKVDACLELYRRMRNSTAKPNQFTLTTLLSACTGSGALGQGKVAHCQAIQMGFESYVHVSNALISMYCKCGNVKESLYLFKNMRNKDLVSWNSMIAGYAQNGFAFQAIDLFEEMKRQTVEKPDSITFLGVLSSCRHGGLLEQAQFYFKSMVEYGLEPKIEHYACVVDLLGRAGDLEKALDFVKNMPINPNGIIWGSLLSSCRLHGHVSIGIEAAENRLVMEPGSAATHLQLVNLYAGFGCWDRAATVRKWMKDKGLKTDPGHSWIEIRNEVHRFRAEENLNSKTDEIAAVVDWLVDHMRISGYVPELYIN
ncbi:hypothetical protein U1Q18_008393 [Sarracenia purpurea var. burkii]